MAAGSAVNAQTSEDQSNVKTSVEEKVVYETNRHKVVMNTFASNWFISAGGGVQTYVGENMDLGGLGKKLSPALDIAVGKWFTPSVGARVMYSGLSGKTAETSDDHTKFGVYNIHLDLMFSLNNIIAGYKEGRIWNFVPYAGIGYAHSYKISGNNDLSINAGVMNSFRLCDALDLNIDIHGMFVDDHFNGVDSGSKTECLTSATLGLAYKFKPRGWKYGRTVYRTDRSEVNTYLQKLNEAAAMNEELKKALAESEVAAKKEMDPIIKIMAAENMVMFAAGQSSLANDARVNLGYLASLIKELDPNTIYQIRGYADLSMTGKEAEELGRGRAEAVFECLVNEFGVNPENLKIDDSVEIHDENDPHLGKVVISAIE